MRGLIAAAAVMCYATLAHSGPLDGKRYIVEMTTSQHASGYGFDLLTPLAAALKEAKLRPATEARPPELVINVVTDRDNGQWVDKGDAQVWLYTVEITVGISPAAYVIPENGKPAFGVRATLQTDNPDRMDETACLIRLATVLAAKHYQRAGLFQTDGSACGR